MEEIKMSGTWKGELIYGEEFPENIRNQKKSFTIEIKETDGEIVGKYFETEGFGIIPESAEITGFIEDDVLSFVKKYPAFYLVNEKGEVNTVPDKEPPEINYSGYFNEETQCFEGDWSMIVEFKQLIFGYSENAVTGTWTMKKEN